MHLSGVKEALLIGRHRCGLELHSLEHEQMGRVDLTQGDVLPTKVWLSIAFPRQPNSR